MLSFCEVEAELNYTSDYPCGRAWIIYTKIKQRHEGRNKNNQAPTIVNPLAVVVKASANELRM